MNTIELIEGGYIRLVMSRKSVKEARECVKQAIAGNSKWKHLAGLNPDKCRLRITRIVSDYYDLDGNPADRINE